MKYSYCLILITVTGWFILHSTLAVDVVTLDLKNPTRAKYTTFLDNIRNNVKDPDLKYGGTTIPVIQAPSNTVMRVNIESTGGTISLAIKRENLYVVAYMARHENRDIVYYFSKQITTKVMDAVFPEATGTSNQQEMEYDESYSSMVKNANVRTRKNASLGIGKVVQYMAEVCGKARKAEPEAKFLLAAVQTVSEAVRFNYIRDMVLKNFPNGFNPDDKVIILESNWGTMSKDIKNSVKGRFDPPKVYKAIKGSGNWTVGNADDLKIGLLLFVK